MKAFPRVKSLRAPEAVARQLEQHDGLANVRCQRITATLRDGDLVLTSSQQRFVFYLYRVRVRTRAQIAAEWQFVAYLAAPGVPVAPAVSTSTGAVPLLFRAPAGAATAC